MMRQERYIFHTYAYLIYNNNLHMQDKCIRKAKHAGSWYNKQKDTLNNELNKYLEQAQCQLKNIKIIKALIGPHAGYAYSGPVAAWAYKYLTNTNQIRIFLLGPSHHLYIDGCSLTTFSEFQTPFGNIKIDDQTLQKLKSEGNFISINQKHQENQHSLEMHLPYIRKMFGDNILLVPIMVGKLSLFQCEQYGKILVPYFDDENTIFIISSDFCHWGAHFDYQPTQENTLIWKSIQNMDKMGLNLIEKNDIQGFYNYMEKTENTICGQYPIKLLMSIISYSKLKLSTNFTKYAQSSKVIKFNDSSVSYASSITYIPQ